MIERDAVLEVEGEVHQVWMTAKTAGEATAAVGLAVEEMIVVGREGSTFVVGLKEHVTVSSEVVMVAAGLVMN